MPTDEEEPTLRVRIDPAGNLQFVGLDPVSADTLSRLPEILRSEDPAVQNRLYPDTYSNEEDQEEWRRYATPELEHLYASRTELIERDLELLEADEDGEVSLVIPAPHRSAWLSGLNAARLTLYVEAGLAPEEIELDPGTLGNAQRDVALARIDCLGLLQHLILEAREVIDGTMTVPLDDDEELDGPDLDESDLNESGGGDSEGGADESGGADEGGDVDPDGGVDEGGGAARR